MGQRRRYRPPPGGKMRKGLARVRKELAGYFFQLLSGHAATAEHFTRIGQAASPQCCGAGLASDRQGSTSLLGAEDGVQRSRVCGAGWRDCEWGGSRAPSMRTLSGDTRATAAVLEFLETTRVGRMPGRVLMAEGQTWKKRIWTR